MIVLGVPSDAEGQRALEAFARGATNRDRIAEDIRTARAQLSALEQIEEVMRSVGMPVPSRIVRKCAIGRGPVTRLWLAAQVRRTARRNVNDNNTRTGK